MISGIVGYYEAMSTFCGKFNIIIAMASLLQHNIATYDETCGKVSSLY